MTRFVVRRLWDGADIGSAYHAAAGTQWAVFAQSQSLAEVQADIEAAFHLDEAVVQKFGRYLWGLAHLDLGPSTRFRDYSLGDMIASGGDGGVDCRRWPGFSGGVATLYGGGLCRRDRWGHRHGGADFRDWPAVSNDCCTAVELAAGGGIAEGRRW